MPPLPPYHTHHHAPCRCAVLYNAAARRHERIKRQLEEQKTNWRVWLYLILEEPRTSNTAMVFAVVSALMILLQVVTIMMESGSFGAEGVTCVEGETTTPVGGQEDDATCALTEYDVADICLTALFTVELVLRSICATSMRELTYSVFWWIDLFGVAPFYLQLILDASLSGVPQGLAAVRSLLRLLRIVRVLKVLRQHPDSEILYSALQRSARPLVVPFTFLVIGTPHAARRTPHAARHTPPHAARRTPHAAARRTPHAARRRTPHATRRRTPHAAAARREAHTPRVALWPILRPCGPPCGRRDLLRLLRL